MWSEPKTWKLPNGESFYGKKLNVFEHTILEYNYVTPKLKNCRRVIDIGAHVGSTSVRYAKDFQFVECFEPMYFEELTHNTNHLKNVNRYNVALSNYSGDIEMVRHKNNSGMTRVIAEETHKYINKKRNSFDKNTHRVKVNPLDNYDFSDVDFIKMDTENYVIPILEGAKRTLENNSPILQIECKENMGEVDNFLKQFGYKLYDTFSVERFYSK